METKKILRGNDITLRIPVQRITDGEGEPFPLSSSTDIAVSLVNPYKRYLLTHSIDTDDDSIITARVEGDQMPCGHYALEVKGRLLGNDWRTATAGVLEIVEFTDSLGDIVDDTLDMGALTIATATPPFNPRGDWTDGTQYKKGDVVSHDGCCWYATEDTTEEPSKTSQQWQLLIDNSDVKATAEALRGMTASYDNGYLTLSWPNL